MSMQLKLLTRSSLAAVFALACGASVPTPELVTARNTLAEARNGPAATVNPKGIYDAEQALRDAEQAHAADAGSDDEKHFAYIATRKAQLAVAQGNQRIAQDNVASAKTEYTSSLEGQVRNLSSQKEGYVDQLESAQRQLSDVRGQLATTDASLDENSAELKLKEQQLAARVAELETAKDARQAAELKAANARAELAELGNVREENGRLLISLSGSVLFKSNSSDLMDMAKRRLDTVADAIEGYGPGAITVEGHTDSRGTEAFNEALSQKRAESVRTYLVGHGLSSASVTAVGRGEAQPIADNETPEGRANNRRVEIIVEQDKTSDARRSSSLSASDSSAKLPSNP
jgi:outer membrane protein OmpA-like peptidoglycan-associated protein